MAVEAKTANWLDDHELEAKPNNAWQDENWLVEIVDNCAGVKITIPEPRLVKSEHVNE